MKKIASLQLFLFLILNSFSQQKLPFKIGLVTKNEVTMKFYDKDSSAIAVVLLEEGISRYRNSKKFPFEKNYYTKIKILKKSAFDKATIEIPLGKNSEVFNIEGVTYNLAEDSTIVKSFLKDDKVFKTKFYKSSTINSFTLPNVKVGSVIEYKYSIKSKNYGLYDWYFQSDIPKIKSSYEARVPPIFYFNIAYVGKINPSINSSKIKSKCIGVDPCQSYNYVLENIPAFIEEKYVSNKENYIAKLIFEKNYFNPYGTFGKNYGWKLLDENFKKLYETRLKKTGFFKRRIPDSIKTELDTLTKVKKTYQFIRDHYTLDNSYNKSLPRSFKEQRADYININLSLYYALKALKLNPKIGLLSTRENGIATKIFPSLESLNYSLTYIKINGKDYFLDATNKKNIFGLVPFKCLNDDVRILDFEKGSYWLYIKSVKDSNKKINSFIELDSDGNLSGKIIYRKVGQFANNYRVLREKVKEDDYLAIYEKKNINLLIEDYKVKNLNNLSKNIIETFDVSIEKDGDNLRINPFIIDRLKENPFKLKERKYPVDFGFPFKEYHTVSIKFPSGLEIESLPKNLTMKLPNNGGKFVFKTSLEQNKISIFLMLSQTKKAYSSEEYIHLKELYNQLIKIQNFTIKIKKKL